MCQWHRLSRFPLCAILQCYNCIRCRLSKSYCFGIVMDVITAVGSPSGFDYITLHVTLLLYLYGTCTVATKLARARRYWLRTLLVFIRKLISQPVKVQVVHLASYVALLLITPVLRTPSTCCTRSIRASALWIPTKDRSLIRGFAILMVHKHGSLFWASHAQCQRQLPGRQRA